MVTRVATTGALEQWHWLLNYSLTQGYYQLRRDVGDLSRLLQTSILSHATVLAAIEIWAGFALQREQSKHKARVVECQQSYILLRL
jgi:hypothetical protein